VNNLDLIERPLRAQSGSYRLGERFAGGPAGRQDFGAPRRPAVGIGLFLFAENPDQLAACEPRREIRDINNVHAYSENHRAALLVQGGAAIR